MKKYLMMMLMTIVCFMSATAQNTADKIVGTYKAVQAGNESKVKIFKHNGGYRAQIIWLKEPKNNMIKADSDLIQARYELVLQKALIDFYRGRDLNF